MALAASFVVGCTESSPTSPEAPRGLGGPVNMSNVDLSSEIGADRLLRRIRDSAKANCNIDKVPPGEGLLARQQSCMYAAMANDVAGVESPVLLARFRRLGASMISAATGDGSSANQHELANANRNATAVLTVNSVTPPISRDLTTDQLNNRESARLRAIGSTADEDAALISPND